MRGMVLLALCLIEPVAAAAARQELVIDPVQSRIDIAVKATVGSFVGTLTKYELFITVDPVTRSIGQVVLEFNVGDVQTGNARRNHDMLEWEHAARFPRGSFTLKALEAGTDGELQARGVLVFHGQSRDIAFPVAIRRDHDRYSIDGDAPLDTQDFGLPIVHSYWFLTVDPIVHVRFHLQGNLDGRERDGTRRQSQSRSRVAADRS